MRTAEERYFTTSDGARLFYRYWPADSAAARRALVLFHRGHEHSGRLQHLVDELDLPGMAMFAWDARGHGRSLEAQSAGATMGVLVKDVDTFVHHISASFGIDVEDIAVLGQSVASVLVAAWVHDYAPRIRCMVLASPAFQVKLYVPFARPALRLMHAIRGDFRVNSYVKPRALTHDPERIASYESDPLIRRPISVNILLALYSTAARVIEDAQAIQVPTQLLISGADYVVRLAPRTASSTAWARWSKRNTNWRASTTTPWAKRTAPPPSPRFADSSAHASRSLRCRVACWMPIMPATPRKSSTA